MNNPYFGYNFSGLEYCLNVEPCINGPYYPSLDVVESFRKEWCDYLDTVKLIGEYQLDGFTGVFDKDVVIILDKKGDSVYNSKDCYDKVILSCFTFARFELDRLKYIINLQWSKS